MQPDKDIQYLTHLVEHLDALHEYAGSIREDDFYANREKMDACLMRLIVVGENVGKLSDELKAANPKVDWRAIKATRNVYVHLYEGVDWPRVWAVLQNNLADLGSEVRRILKEKEDNATNE